ncbi:2OG-Fe(II) oxygenase [Streptomyces canarius]|uniref:2OG-Fe(II) oxygenase n=1 Tax=Streptomyces TaxID=1883 RepID=UPI0035715111
MFGEPVFPLQVVIAPDAHGTDCAGGEFLMSEQRPRAQSRGTASVSRQGTGCCSPPGTAPCAPASTGRPGLVLHGAARPSPGRARPVTRPAG